MTTLVAQIIAHLTANYGQTPKPDFKNREKLEMGERQEQVKIKIIGEPLEEIVTFDRAIHSRVTRFELLVEGFVSESDRDDCITELSTQIRAKSGIVGHWEIESPKPVDADNTFGAIIRGREVLHEI